MKGQHLAIGLIFFVLAVVVILYFTMMSTFKKDETGMEPDAFIIKVADNTIALADLE